MVKNNASHQPRPSHSWLLSRKDLLRNPARAIPRRRSAAKVLPVLVEGRSVLRPSTGGPPLGGLAWRSGPNARPGHAVVKVLPGRAWPYDSKRPAGGQVGIAGAIPRRRCAAKALPVLVEGRSVLRPSTGGPPLACSPGRSGPTARPGHALVPVPAGPSASRTPQRGKPALLAKGSTLCTPAGGYCIPGRKPLTL